MPIDLQPSHYQHAYIDTCTVNIAHTCRLKVHVYRQHCTCVRRFHVVVGMLTRITKKKNLAQRLITSHAATEGCGVMWWLIEAETSFMCPFEMETAFAVPSTMLGNTCNQDTSLVRTPHTSLVRTPLIRRLHYSRHFTNQDISLVRTPHQPGHFTNQDTSLIRTPH